MTLYSDRYDYFVPEVTDDCIWFERTQSSGRGTYARCLDRCWASVVVDGPALGGCPVFAGRVYTLCWFSVGSSSSALSRHCPDIGSILVFAVIYNIV